MTIPSNISAAMASLQAQVAAAGELSQASWPTIRALQLNAQALLQAVEAAQYSLAGNLDTWAAPTDPEPIISGVIGLYNNALDEASIALMRAVIGRVADNLDQLGPAPPPVQYVASGPPPIIQGPVPMAWYIGARFSGSGSFQANVTGGH
jgi:hypothetical protein